MNTHIKNIYIDHFDWRVSIKNSVIVEKIHHNLTTTKEYKNFLKICDSVFRKQK
jgi:hypothetical protein